MRWFNPIFIFVLIYLSAGSASAQAVVPPSQVGRPMTIVATTTHIADFARSVAGDRAVVTALLPANADPHAFEPTPQDVKTISQADVILMHGLRLDAWLQKVIDNAGGNGRLYVVTKGLPLRPGDDDSPEGDPHVWHNVDLAKLMVTNIRVALTESDPAGEMQYLQNADRYNTRLTRLGRELKAEINTIPVENRKMVTNHDAFHYYADYFGLEFIGSIIPGTSTESQASAGSIGRLIRLIIDRKVNAVFTENTVESKVAQDIVDQTGAKVLAGLYGDSLGEKGSGAETYEGMMRANTHIITEALK